MLCIQSFETNKTKAKKLIFGKMFNLHRLKVENKVGSKVEKGKKNSLFFSFDCQCLAEGPPDDPPDDFPSDSEWV